MPGKTPMLTNDPLIRMRSVPAVAVLIAMTAPIICAMEVKMIARVETINQTPVLTLNGKPHPAMIFFFNSSMNIGQENLRPQVEMARSHGVHLYSMPFVNWPWLEYDKEMKPVPPDYTESTRILDRYLEVDPEALFLLRIWSTPPHSWKGWEQLSRAELALYDDGSTGMASLASEPLWKAFLESFQRMVEHFEASPYGPHIIGYHIGGQNSTEWFCDMYREKGPDYSAPNQTGFRRWLEKQYRTENALQSSWGDPDAAFQTAQIPKFEKGRFPVRGIQKDETLVSFYLLPHDRPWVDYSRYISELVTDRIMDAAGVSRKATQGNKLTAFFFGYLFDLPGSMSGHWELERILNCPDIDILCAPYSYLPLEERLSGGSSGAMSLIDSVAAHGKLWINEDDMRTHLIDKEKELPVWLSEEGFGKQTSSLSETINLLKRNLGFVQTHRGGTWWMDLIAAGSFADDAIWGALKTEILPKWEKRLSNPAPYQPDVAILVDPMSRYLCKNDWDLSFHGLTLLRNNAMKSGASVGFYLLSDFINGIAPECPVYLFANAFWLSDSYYPVLQSRIKNSKSAFIWLYAPGFMPPDGISLERMRSLTGFNLVQNEGLMGSLGKGLLEGLSWGWPTSNRVSPRFVLEDSRAETLGVYRDCRLPSSGMVHTGQQSSFFLGDFEISPDVLRRLFRAGGAHIWTEGGEVVHTDKDNLIIHSGNAGSIPVSLPAGTLLVRNGEGLKTDPASGKVEITSKAGETHWFEISRSN